MKNYHQKPSQKVRGVICALNSANQRRIDLPLRVQVKASDWDTVILADRVYELADRVYELEESIHNLTIDNLRLRSAIKYVQEKVKGL